MFLLKRLFACLLLSTILFACNNPQTKSTESKAPVKPVILDSTDDLISLDTFYSWQNRWNKTYRHYMGSTTLNFIDMPVVDLTTIVGENADKARMFLGMKQLAPGHYEPHLMTMGVTGTRVDSSRILDYTHACPPYCD